MCTPAGCVPLSYAQRKITLEARDQRFSFRTAQCYFCIRSHFYLLLKVTLTHLNSSGEIPLPASMRTTRTWFGPWSTFSRPVTTTRGWSGRSNCRLVDCDWTALNHCCMTQRQSEHGTVHGRMPTPPVSPLMSDMCGRKVSVVVSK